MEKVYTSMSMHWPIHLHMEIHVNKYLEQFPKIDLISNDADNIEIDADADIGF